MSKYRVKIKTLLSSLPFFNHLYDPSQEPTALGEVISRSGHTNGLAQHPDDLCLDRDACEINAH